MLSKCPNFVEFQSVVFTPPVCGEHQLRLAIPRKPSHNEWKKTIILQPQLLIKKGMDLARTGMAYLRIEISPSPSYVGEFRNLVAPNPTYIEYIPIRLLFRNSVSRCYDAGRCFTRLLVSDNAFVSRLLFCFLRGDKTVHIRHKRIKVPRYSYGPPAKTTPE